MTPTPDPLTDHERVESAVWHALLYILQWSDDEVRKLGAGAAEEFIRALQQDGHSVAALADTQR